MSRRYLKYVCPFTCGVVVAVFGCFALHMKGWQLVKDGESTLVVTQDLLDKMSRAQIDALKVSTPEPNDHALLSKDSSGDAGRNLLLTYAVWQQLRLTERALHGNLFRQVGDDLFIQVDGICYSRPPGRLVWFIENHQNENVENNVFMIETLSPTSTPIVRWNDGWIRLPRMASKEKVKIWCVWFAINEEDFGGDEITLPDFEQKRRVWAHNLETAQSAVINLNVSQRGPGEIMWCVVLPTKNPTMMMDEPATAE